MILVCEMVGKAVNRPIVLGLRHNARGCFCSCILWPRATPSRQGLQATHDAGVSISSSIRATRDVSRQARDANAPLAKWVDAGGSALFASGR